ncbi:MAG: tRNA (adenosine(37)-N6)-threonylcarbamoyltransferase complex ATPase subunit type 1 TsaE [Clostridia bacterium]|nr:tRNA (adenosine(37)-N6)-threonylcarbamoyltransferase complex ATPase subunit type 1 TsaE [Clostridia bacterium]
MIIHSSDTAETEKAGAELAKKLKPRDFVALYGDLGAGKTAFVRGAASVLCPGAAVCSPTYAIMNRYDGNTAVYHFDLYRITDGDDLYSTGYYDIIEENAVFFCEWCEKCPEAIPDGAIKVRISREGDGRRIEIADTFS